VTVVCKWACAGLGDEVNSIGAGLGVRGRLGWYCVRPVALSGLLLRWQSRALVCCCVGRGWVAETFLIVRTLRVVRS